MKKYRAIPFWEHWLNKYEIESNIIWSDKWEKCCIVINGSENAKEFISIYNDKQIYIDNEKMKNEKYIKDNTIY